MSLRNSIEREFGVPVKLRAGAPGSLNISVNGERIFSKQQTGRSPTPEELAELIRKKSSG